MIKLDWCIKLLAPVTMILLQSAPALANYITPREFETYTIVQDKWAIKERTAVSKLLSGQRHILAVHRPLVGSNKDYEVEMQRGSKTLRFPINRFMLAHYTDSNTICSGSFMQFTEKYLEDVQKKQTKSEALITLSAMRQDGPLEVVGIWPFNAATKWERVIQEGSTYLHLSAEKARALLKSPEGYHAAMLKFSNDQWAKISKRGADSTNGSVK